MEDKCLKFEDVLKEYLPTKIDIVDGSTEDVVRKFKVGACDRYNGIITLHSREYDNCRIIVFSFIEDKMIFHSKGENAVVFSAGNDTYIICNKI